MQRALNIIVAGGTGSGKTTLCNALPGDHPSERIITIEETAELRSSSRTSCASRARPANIEGRGESVFATWCGPHCVCVLTGSSSVRCRGGEALDMLQALNTGHDGSLSTVHANAPPAALARLETLVLMAGMDLPLQAIRDQISSAVDVVIQLSRLRDGTRRVTYVTEVQGMEGDTVTMQDAFLFDYSAGLDANGRFLGKPLPTGVRPRFTDRFIELGIRLSPSVFGTPPPADRR